MGGIQIAITAGPDAASSEISVTGQIKHIITDSEVKSFGIQDSQLKDAVKAYFGKRPDDAYLHSPTPWDDLYKSYKWPEVQTVLVAESASILDVTSHPEVIASNKFVNNSHVVGTFNASVSQQVSNTETTSWTETTTLSLSETISAKISFEGLGEAGASVTWGLSQSFGVSETKSETVTVGSSAGISVLLKPGESVQANLNASRGTMRVRIVYRAYLVGDTAINYGHPYKDHHFWALPIDGVMSAGGISNSLKFTQDMSIGYYADSSVTLVDAQGKPVNATLAKAV